METFESQEKISAYNIKVEEVEIDGLKAELYRVGFGSPAQNDQIVKDALTQLEEIEQNREIKEASDETGPTLQELALINGPASLPVSLVLGKHLDQRFKAIAVFDPKLSKYVVSISNGSQYSAGDLIG
jgi:CRISPR-associated protein Csx3